MPVRALLPRTPSASPCQGDAGRCTGWAGGSGRENTGGTAPGYSRRCYRCTEAPRHPACGHGWKGVEEPWPRWPAWGRAFNTPLRQAISSLDSATRAALSRSRKSWRVAMLMRGAPILATPMRRRTAFQGTRANPADRLANYTADGTVIGRDLISEPELVAPNRRSRWMPPRFWETRKIIRWPMQMMSRR